MGKLLYHVLKELFKVKEILVRASQLLKTSEYVYPSSRLYIVGMVKHLEDPSGHPTHFWCFRFWNAYLTAFCVEWGKKKTIQGQVVYPNSYLSFFHCYCIF